MWLSLRVTVYCRGNKISMGHNSNDSLLKRMRAQGNFIEYAPFGVILLALVEFSGAPALAVHLLGLLLLIGRALHTWGFSAPFPVMNGPVFGIILTLTIILLSALGLLLHTLF